MRHKKLWQLEQQKSQQQQQEQQANNNREREINKQISNIINSEGHENNFSFLIKSCCTHREREGKSG